MALLPTPASVPASHFDPVVRARLKAFLTEKYIHTPQNAELWCLLEDLMYQVSPSNPKPKVMGCLVTGDPHSGKTTAVRQFKKAYLENVPEANALDIFLTQIPSRARLKGVMVRMGQELKIPDISANPGRDYPTYALVEKVATKLGKNGTKLMIIDEFQKLFELPGESRVEILSGFNDLANESHVPIVLVGVAGVERILEIERYDADEGNLKGCFCSRFPEFHLGSWDDPHAQDFGALLTTIYEDCGLNSLREDLPFYKNGEIREWLVKVTSGLTGKIIHLIKWAARLIIRKSLPENITQEVFQAALAQLQAKGW